MKGSQVTIDHVSKRFGDFVALDDINFTIKPGEFFSLLGPSGCGKTTLLRIIAGFEFPDEGVVLFDDKNVILRRHVMEGRKLRLGASEFYSRSIGFILIYFFFFFLDMSVKPI